MFKSALAALAGAGALLGSTCASAAVVYTESGVAFATQSFNDWPIGYTGLWNAQGSPFIGPVFTEGRYSFDLTVDTSKILQIDEYTTAFRWGQVTFPFFEFIEQSLPSDAVFNTTPTGVSGTFSVGPAHSDANSFSTDYGSVGLRIFVKAGESTPYVFTVTALPEPATWAIMLVGFGGVGVALRTRRRLAITAA
jgi:hypothetical protein